MKTIHPRSHQLPLLHHRLSARLVLTLVASLAILPLGASADDPAKLPLSIFCVEYAPSLKSIYVKTPADPHKMIDLSTANVVAAGDVPLVDGVIPLYGPPTTGTEYPMVASVRPGAIRKPLMVILPNSQPGGMPYQSRVVDMDMDKFPLGSYRIVNLSPHPVRFRTGDKSKDIAPHAEMLFNPALKAGDVAAVTIEYKPGNDWLVVSSSRWAGRKDRRSLVCVHMNPQTKRMLIKSIPLRE